MPYSLARYARGPIPRWEKRLTDSAEMLLRAAGGYAMLAIALKKDPLVSVLEAFDLLSSCPKLMQIPYDYNQVVEWTNWGQLAIRAHRPIQDFIGAHDGEVRLLNEPQTVANGTRPLFHSLSAALFLHSEGIIALGQHAKTLTTVHTGLWCSLTLLDFYATVGDADERKGMRNALELILWLPAQLVWDDSRVEGMAGLVTGLYGFYSIVTR